MQRDALQLSERFATLVAVLAAAPSVGAGVAAAQASPQGAQHGVTRECAPERITSGNFVCGPAETLDLCTNLVAGDLDGNLSPEVAALQGSKLVLFVNPDVGDNYIVVDTQTLDVCAPPGQARFLFSTSAGLLALELQSDQVRVRKLADGPGWKGARQLRAYPEGWLFVLGADRRTFYRAKADGEGFQPPQELFAVPFEVREFHLLDWDDAEGPEIALLDGVGLQVRRSDGTVLLDHKALVPGDALTPVARTGARDGLAWITRLSDKNSYLFHFRPEFGSGFEGPLPLGPLRYDSLDAGDLDGDGDEDLVLGGRESTTAPLLMNRASSPTEPAFSGLDGAFDLALEKEGQVLVSGRVLCHDLFNDRLAGTSVRPAVASLLFDPPGLRLVPQGKAPNPTATPEGTSEHFDTVDFVSARHRNGCQPGGTPPVPRALWNITLGSAWQAPTATHVEAIVRVSPMIGTAPERVALHHSMTPIPSGGLTGTSVLFEGLEGPSDPEASKACYFVQLRPVRLDAAGQNILAAWQWRVVGVSAHCDGLAWLGTLPGAIAETAPILVTSCTPVLSCDFGIPVGPGLLGPVYIPSAVPQLRVPSSGPGVLPLVWPWNY